MKAEVTYNAGSSYRIKGKRFEKGKTEVVTAPYIIKKCQATVGFSVRMLDETEEKPKKKKKVRAVAAKSTKKKVKSKDK